MIYFRLANTRYIVAIILLILLNCKIGCQSTQNNYWATDALLTPHRLLHPSLNEKIIYIDLDNDGDPDLIRYNSYDNTPIQWLDDDDDMLEGDLEGDIDNDCLMIDRNKDGKYGSHGDFMIDWIDTDNDSKADLQAVVGYKSDTVKKIWGGGNYMWSIDTDKDGILNYINWKIFRLKCWSLNGRSNFFEDYHGQTLFLKIHVSTYNLNDLRLNWENPFLFYDKDDDGLSEIAIRLLDQSKYLLSREEIADTPENNHLTGKISYASISIDLDNDNAPSNEFDLDMTINFRGGGFDYLDQVHSLGGVKRLKEMDTAFQDPRWRQLTELIYPDHDAAWELIFNRGKWDQCWFVYDEDDDCNRWERVELYEPLSPFKIGRNKEGLDNNRQSDASGDRGEWDTDNSGNGKLYIGRFDNKIHLYGAEWGCWRIDQEADSYQGWGGIYDGTGKRSQIIPNRFPTIKYSDNNNNGFFDKLEFDLDGDTIFEHTVSLLELEINDECEVIDISEYRYEDYLELKKNVANKMWKKAEYMLELAKKMKINSDWYSIYMHPKSIWEKYNNGFWLAFYLYMDMRDLALRKKDYKLLIQIDRDYFSGD